jgi:hypothetical protein
MFLVAGEGSDFFAYSEGYVTPLSVVSDGVQAVGPQRQSPGATNRGAQFSAGNLFFGSSVVDAGTLAEIGAIGSNGSPFADWARPFVVSKLDATIYLMAYSATENSGLSSQDGRVQLFDTTSRSFIDTMSLIDMPSETSRFIETRPGEFAFISGLGQGPVVLFFGGVRRGSAGEFTPLTPQRILDSRVGTGRPGRSSLPLGQGQIFDVEVAGRAGVPAENVSAVVLNVTATAPTKNTFLSVYPTGIAVPDISNLNIVAGETRPNLVTVKVGEGGKVSIFNAIGATHVLFDVAGYYSRSSGSPGSRFVPVSPTRVLDTRSGLGGVSTKIGDSTPLAFGIAGRNGLPSSGMTAVALNVTITKPTAYSFLSVYPGDVLLPDVSNLNYSPGINIPNQVIVRLPADGVLKFENDAGATDLIVDVVGYYHIDNSNERGRFFPATPVRFLDTRVEQIFPGNGKVYADDGVVVTYPDEPYAAWVMNVTAVEAEADGFITVYPEPGTPPNSSNLNFKRGQTVPNHVISPTGPGIGFYNVGGPIHILADYFGGFT